MNTLSKLTASLFILFGVISGFSQTQVVNLSTGLSSLNTPLSVGSNDDTWMISYPGSNGFVSPLVSTGFYTSSIGPLAYPCQPNNADWIGPVVNTAGHITTQLNSAGTHIYQHQFYLNHGCNFLDSATLIFQNISCDNRVINIKINNTSYVQPLPGIGFSACFALTINIANPNTVLNAGLNTIQIITKNNESVGALLLDGDLKIYSSNNLTPLTAAFVWNNTQPFCTGSPVIVDGSVSTGPIVAYKWEVQSTHPNCTDYQGGPAWGYNWIAGSNPGTLDISSLGLPCGLRYKVRLSVMDACGNVWNSAYDPCFMLNCAPVLDLSNSTVEICSGGKPAVSLMSNCQNCNVNIIDLNSNTSVFNGPPNQALILPQIFSTTNYTIILTDLTSGCSVSVPWTVYAMSNYIPVSFNGSSNAVCPGNTGFIVADASGYSNFANCTMTIKEISTNTIIYSGFPSIAIPVTLWSTETYEVTVQDPDGCVSVYYHTIKVVNCGIGIGGDDDWDGNAEGIGPKRNATDENQLANHTDEHSTIIYPNPTNGMISFEVNTEKEDVYTVTITDLAGKKIESFEQMKTNDKQLRITWDTASLVAGEYLVTIVNSANEIMVKKFIKE